MNMQEDCIQREGNSFYHMQYACYTVPCGLLNRKIPRTSFPSLCGLDELRRKDTVHSTSGSSVELHGNLSNVTYTNFC